MNIEYSIWKYPLDITNKQKIIMPKGAKILSVQNQNHSPTIWALINTEAVPEEREIYCFGTGEPLNTKVNELIFIGTVQNNNGSLVFHIFEKPV